MGLGKKLEDADDNSWVVLVEEELAGSYTVPVDAQIERIPVDDWGRETKSKRCDAPWKLTHEGWNKQEEEPCKRAVEQPDMVLEGVVHDDDDENHDEEDEEETV